MGGVPERVARIRRRRRTEGRHERAEGGIERAGAGEELDLVKIGSGGAGEIVGEAAELPGVGRTGAEGERAVGRDVDDAGAVAGCERAGDFHGAAERAVAADGAAEHGGEAAAVERARHVDGVAEGDAAADRQRAAGADADRPGGAAERAVASDGQRAGTDSGAAGIGIRSGKCERAGARLGQAKAIATDRSADGERAAIDRDLTAGTERDGTRAEIERIRAGESKIAVPSLGIIARGYRAAAGIVDRSSADDESVRRISEGRCVVDIHRAGTKGEFFSAAAKSVRAGQRQDARACLREIERSRNDHADVEGRTGIHDVEVSAGAELQAQARGAGRGIDVAGEGERVAGRAGAHHNEIVGGATPRDGFRKAAATAERESAAGRSGGVD